MLCYSYSTFLSILLLNDTSRSNKSNPKFSTINLIQIKSYDSHRSIDSVKVHPKYCIIYLRLQSKDTLGYDITKSAELHFAMAIVRVKYKITFSKCIQRKEKYTADWEMDEKNQFL